MKIKIENAHYDPKTGSSIVNIKTNKGYFYGFAQFHPQDDERLKSSYFGCEIAKNRALIAYAKAVKKEEMLKLKGMIEAYNIMNDIQRIDNQSSAMRIMRRTISRQKDKIEDIKKSIINLEEYINASVTNREKLLLQFYNKKQK